MSVSALFAYVESYFFFQIHTKDNISRYTTSSSFYLSVGYFSIVTSIYQHFGFIIGRNIFMQLFLKFVMSFLMHFLMLIYFNTCLIWVFCDVKEYYKIIKILVVKFNILMSFVWQIYMTFLNFRTCWNSWESDNIYRNMSSWRDCTDGFVLCYVELFLDYFYNRKQIFFKKSSWGWKSSVVFWKCCSGPPLCL